MARKSQDLRRIEAREHELVARIEQLERELETVRGEHRKVKTAREVLEELSGLGAPEPEPSTSHELQDIDLPPASPEEIYADVQNFADLTIGDMAVQVLRSGPPEGLTSNQILDTIREKWTSNLLRSSLSPPLSRLKKKGIIDLVGEHWRLAAANEAKTTD